MVSAGAGESGAAGAGPGESGAAGGAPGRYVPGIDGLRAVAILAVILFHLVPAALPGGFAGVDLFFVISGFVVTGSLAGRTDPGAARLIGHFYARRMVRILPALLAMLLAVSLLCALLLRGSGPPIARAVAIPAFFGASNVALALAQDDYFVPKADFSPFLHTWTLGVEEQFYLIFPFVFILIRGGFADRRRNIRAFAWLAAACLLSFAAGTWLAAGHWRYAFYLMPTRLWELAAGVALRLTMQLWSPRIAGLGGAAAAVASAASAAALLLAFVLPGGSAPFAILLLPVAAALGLIAIVCARPSSRLARTLGSPGPRFVGRISYSLYLWHWPVFVLMRWTIGTGGLWRGALALALTFAAAIASTLLVEQPLRRSGWARQRPGAAFALGAGAAAAGAALATLIFMAQPRFAGETATRSYWEGAPFAAGCQARSASAEVEGGFVYGWRPACRRTAPGPRRLFVAGDSHARVLGKLLARYAADTNVPVTVYFKAGCDFPPLSVPVGGKPECAAFIRMTIERLARDLAPGDLLFMPSLRVARFRDEYSEQMIEPGPPDAGARDRADREARAVLRRLSATGARLVLQAPLPLFRSPLFRCSDWFNRINPVCSDGFEIGRAEMLGRRAPALAQMRGLESAVPRLGIWDPFPILCPRDPCSALRDGKPIYYDGDHLDGRGNDLLYPDFARMAAAGGAAQPR